MTVLELNRTARSEDDMEHVPDPSPLASTPTGFAASRGPRTRIRRRAGAMAFALAVHAAPLLLMLAWPARTPPYAPTPDPVMFLELAPPAAPPTPPSERPPAPKQVKAEAPKPKPQRERSPS